MQQGLNLKVQPFLHAPEVGAEVRDSDSCPDANLYFGTCMDF